MAIEFRCTQCGKLLRTPDDTAGRMAKCPECGEIMTIPAAPIGHDSPTPGQSPDWPFQPANVVNASRPIVPSRIDLGDIFSRTWTLFQSCWGECLLASLIVVLLNTGVGSVAGGLPIFGIIISFAFSLWTNIGQRMYFLKKARGQQVDFGELFNGWPYYVNSLLVLLILIAVWAGIAIVCMLPLLVVALATSAEPVSMIVAGVAGGVVALGLIWYVHLLYSQSFYLIIDRNAEAIESLKTSQRLMDGNKLMLLLIQLVTSVISILVMLFTCFVGVLAVAPFVAMMNAVIYLTITGQPTALELGAELGNGAGPLPPASSG